MSSLPEFAHRFIHGKIKRLNGRYGLTPSDREDLRQWLTACLDRVFRASPKPKNQEAFATRVINNLVATLVRGRRAKKRDHRRETSLHTLTLDEDGAAVEMSRLLPENVHEARRGRFRSRHEQFDLATDLEQTLGRLPAELRSLCELLKECDVTEAAVRAQKPRSTVVDLLHRLRKDLRNTQLHLYQ